MLLIVQFIWFCVSHCLSHLTCQLTRLKNRQSTSSKSSILLIDQLTSTNPSLQSKSSKLPTYQLIKQLINLYQPIWGTVPTYQRYQRKARRAVRHVVCCVSRWTCAASCAFVPSNMPGTSCGGLKQVRMYQKLLIVVGMVVSIYNA